MDSPFRIKDACAIVETPPDRNALTRHRFLKSRATETFKRIRVVRHGLLAMSSARPYIEKAYIFSAFGNTKW